MSTSDIGYGSRVEVRLSFDEAVRRTREALAAEGFGVLCDIDVQKTLKTKLDVDFRRYVILGACNPPLAHRALTTDSDIGLLLPCNVVVYESDEPDETVIAAIDPIEQLGITARPELEPVARAVGQRLKRVLEAVTT